MKTLISIVNCHTRTAYADTLRETWIPRIPTGLDYKLFRGASDAEAKPDEVFLNCDDTYSGLPNKVQEIAKWALAHDYDYMLKCDDDVVLMPERFMQSGYDKHDFVGNINRTFPKVTVPWGFCYTLSRKAMEIVASEKLPNNNNDEAWISDMLYLRGINLHKDRRYQLYTGRRECFVEVKKRPLRAPARHFLTEPLPMLSEVIAYCMFIPWVGYGSLPEDKNIQELRKVFKELTQ